MHTSLQRLRQIADQFRALHGELAQHFVGPNTPSTGVALLAEAVDLGVVSSEDPRSGPLRLVIHAWKMRDQIEWNEVLGTRPETDPNIITFQRAIEILFPDQFSDTIDGRGKSELQLWVQWSMACEAIADALEAGIKRMASSIPAKPDQGKGNGGIGSTPEQPAVTSGADKAAILAKLQPAVRKAYLSSQYAMKKAERWLHPREAHAWLKENGIDADKDDVGEIVDYRLPTYGTWSRQDRNARNRLGEQIYTRRAGRATGRSIVSGREIEYQKGDDK